MERLPHHVLFAALAAARSLIKKEAHFIAGVAFMFASTNLVMSSASSF
ncbi:MAG: hypothetical protein U5K69_01170 [Balneolaceae bacterium]|nr:hypothetical protein [Balneolaceae bacterium]